MSVAKEKCSRFFAELDRLLNNLGPDDPPAAQPYRENSTMTDPEYIKCIRQTHADHLNESWCGKYAPKSTTWCFENIDHAIYNSGRMLPCPECLNVIIAKLNALTEPYHSPTNQQE